MFSLKKIKAPTSFNMVSSEIIKASVFIDDDFGWLNEEVVVINYCFSKLNEEVVDINYSFSKLNKKVVDINYGFS